MAAIWEEGCGQLSTTTFQEKIRRVGEPVHQVTSNDNDYNVAVNTHLSKLFEFQGVLKLAE